MSGAGFMYTYVVAKCHPVHGVMPYFNVVVHKSTNLGSYCFSPSAIVRYLDVKLFPILMVVDPATFACHIGLLVFLPQLYHEVQSPHTFAYIIDISDHNMVSEVFNTSGSMGAMPKKVITQADYFWVQDTTTATAVITTPDSQIGTTLSGVAQGLLDVATETVGAAVCLINRFQRRCFFTTHEHMSTDSVTVCITNGVNGCGSTSRFINTLIYYDLL
ncbi:hypothetical protein EDB19DRAFT_1826962 [Suillus lakei]|nr:hypothetical protein EDB19DRAFT_1826962 [Suillus lakei]